MARDPRRRADALEALASLREAVAIKPILPLLERQIGREAEHAGATPPAAWSQLTQVASGHDDPWIRRAAQRSVLKLAAAAYGPPRGKALGTPERDRPELPIERVLSLHQVTMFRNLPLDTLLQVDRVLEQRAYVDGEVVADPETGGRYLCILIQGSVLLDRPGLPPRLLQAVATFGEAAVVDELMPAPRAVARGGCIVLRMSAVTFNDLAGEHPEIWVETCRLLARHLEVGPLEVGPLEPAAAA